MRHNNHTIGNNIIHHYLKGVFGPHGVCAHVLVCVCVWGGGGGGGRVGAAGGGGGQVVCVGGGGGGGGGRCV